MIRPGTESDARLVPSLEPDWKFRVMLAAAMGGVVVFHVVWLMTAMRTVQTHPKGGALRFTAPSVSYLGNPDALSKDTADDVRQVRSPILFALPTHVGFSGPLLAEARGLAPPSMVPDVPPRIRTLDQPFTALPFGASMRDLKQLMQTPRTMPVPRPVDEAVTGSATQGVASKAFLVYWMDRPDQSLESIPVSGTETWAGRMAWDMVLFVCFDDDGLIKQVMIEKPSPYQDVTTAVLRIARGMTFGAPMYGECGRLVVVYRPAEERADGATP